VKFRPSPLLQLLRRLARSIDANGVRGAIVHAWRRLFRSLKSHGLRGTLSRAFIKAPTVAGEPAPEPAHPFDLKNGIDTGGYYSSADLHGKTLSSFYTTAYYGIAPSALASPLSGLNINYSEFTFADVGAAKAGRSWLLPNFHFTGFGAWSSLRNSAKLLGLTSHSGPSGQTGPASSMKKRPL
jgi:hypothetical protein